MPFIHAVWHALIQPSPTLTETGQRLQSQLVAALLLAVCPMSLLILLLPLIFNEPELFLTPITLLGGVVFVLLAVAYGINRRGHYLMATWLTLLVLTAAVFSTVLVSESMRASSLLVYLALPVLFSSLLMSARFTGVFSVLLIVTMIMMTPFMPSVQAARIPIIFLFFFTPMLVLIVHYRNKLAHERQATLSESEERFRTIFMQSPIGVLLVNDMLQPVRSNQRICEILGYTHEELQARRMSDIFHPEDLWNGHRVFESGQMQRAFERRCVTHSGSIIWVNLTFSFVREGRDRFILLMLEDITERKNAEQRVQETEKLRLALEKERELGEFKDQFIAAVSHEFRTPLTMIFSAAEMLERYSGRYTPEERLEYLARIKGQVDNLTIMVDDLLELNRNEASQVKFNPQIVDLLAFCQEFVHDHRAELEEAHQFRFIHEGDMEAVPADTSLLRYILTNLISNAIKYTPQGGSIILALHREASTISIQVIDSGIGISPENLPHVFDPFYRGGNVGVIKGRGLGLKIARDYTARHGGTITCQSEVGHGTTFTVRLPMTVMAQTTSTDC